MLRTVGSVILLVYYHFLTGGWEKNWESKINQAVNILSVLLLLRTQSVTFLMNLQSLQNSCLIKCELIQPLRVHPPGCSPDARGQVGGLPGEPGWSVPGPGASPSLPQTWGRSHRATAHFPHWTIHQGHQISQLVSDSPVSAENISYEAFVFGGYIGWCFSLLLYWRKGEVLEI